MLLFWILSKDNLNSEPCTRQLLLLGQRAVKNKMGNLVRYKNTTFSRCEVVSSVDLSVKKTWYGMIKLATGCKS